MGQVVIEAASRDFAQSPTILIADSEDYFSHGLARASRAWGMEVLIADNVEDAVNAVETARPKYVAVDQQLPAEGALRVLQALKSVNHKARCVVVTRYPSLACAVKAVKQGAWDYLAKPISPEMVLESLADTTADAEALKACAETMSVNRVEWEHIHRVLTLNNENISATARALGMHRRTLQRKLAKYPSLR